MKGQNDKAQRAVRRYEALLRLYPRRYREAFGTQMLRTFQDQYHDASEHDGSVGLAFWLAVISDEIKGIAKEQVMTLSARRILPILVVLGLIELVGTIIFPVGGVPAPLMIVLVIVPFLAILSFVLILAMLLKTWVRKWQIVAVIFLAVGALGIFGVQGAVRAATTNTWCTTAHTLSSQPPAVLMTATDYFTQGDYDYDHGDCDRAIADYTEAITLDPAFAEAYNNRAYTFMAQQDYARALPDLDRAIQLRPDYAHALMNRGDIYNYYYNIDRGRAIADYDRIIALGPEATRDTSVCGHRFLAVHDGWNLGTVLEIAHARC